MFAALRDSDFSEVKALLENWERETVSGALNSPILTPSPDSLISDAFRITLPWTVAVVHSSSEILEYLIQLGVDTTVLDVHENNCVHLLCYAAYMNPSLEQNFIRRLAFVKDTLKFDDLKWLLLQENKQKLRPLELAAHLGTMGLFMEIFETPGVHLLERQDGTFVEQLFDITGYEAFPGGTRRDKSPLVFLQCIDKAATSTESMKKFVNLDYIQQWHWLKLKCNALVLMILGLSSVVLTGSFLYLDASVRFKHEIALLPANGANDTCLIRGYKSFGHSNFTYFLAVGVLFMFSTSGLTMEVHNTLRIWSSPGFRPLPDRKKNLLLYRWIQTLSKGLMHLCVLAFAAVALARRLTSIDVPHPWDDCLFVAILMLVSWFFITYAQVIPRLGFYAILLERMLFSLSSFIFFFLLVLYSFSMITFRLFNRHRSECLEDFSSLIVSFYSCFLGTLNMLDFKEISTKVSGQVPFLAVIFIQVLLVYSLVIFLLNFLVALFTRNMEEIGRKETIITLTQCSYVCSNVENTWGRIFTFLYKRMQRKYFFSQDGRLYLRRVLFRTGESIRNES